MTTHQRKALILTAAGIGLGLGAYLTYAAKTWLAYGQTHRSSNDPLLDRFMPEFDVREHHRVRVAAPAEVALLAAYEMDFSDSLVMHTLFRVRQLIMGGKNAPEKDKRLIGGMLGVMRSIGWHILDEIPGREIALGTGAQPWLADGEFLRIPANRFRSFRKPRYVKIALTLKVEPISASECFLSTETRALATDEFARKRFRAYWAFLSPGIRLLRWPMLSKARKIAEAEVRSGASGRQDTSCRLHRIETCSDPRVRRSESL